MGFTLPLLPMSAIAGYFVIQYQLEILDPVIVSEGVCQVGSLGALIAISVLQTVLYAALCGFFGHILAGKVGLIQPVRFRKKPVLVTLLLSLVGGILFSLDYWTFGAVIPWVRQAAVDMLTPTAMIAAVLYGGIVEELMMRLFFMSLVAWLLKLIFCHKQEEVPSWVSVTANIIAALLFAAGHLPSIVALYGALTFPVILRCFLLNGAFGLFFGWLFRKYGIQYAMISHALLHMISKLIWFVFI